MPDDECQMPNDECQMLDCRHQRRLCHPSCFICHAAFGTVLCSGVFVSSHQSPVLGFCLLRSANSWINRWLVSSMVLGTTILSWTKRSPSGLPPEAGTPCPLSRSFSPEELPGGMVSDFMPSSDGTSTLAPRIASGTVIGTSTTRFRSSRLK